MRLSARVLVMATIAVVTASAVVVVPSVRPPALHSVASPAIRLIVAVQPLTTRSDNISSLADEIRLGIVPSLGAPLPTPPKIPGPSPAPTNFEFEDLIQNTYHAIEPWVRYGFELATYAVGWIPFVGWLSPQIMIFYNFGERIFHSFVDNSAEWLWGPLPFFEGLGNWAQDSWNALVQLGIDQWNFWLPSFPLPPLPFTAQQAQAQLATGGTLAPADQSVAPPTVRPHPLRDALAALRRLLAGADPVAPQNVDLREKVGLQEKVGLHVNERALVDVQRVAAPANPGDDLQVQADLPRTDATPRNRDERKTNPLVGTPNLSGATSDITRPPLTPLGKPKPFGKKPNPASETSNPPTRPSNESVGASNSSVGTSNDAVGTPHPPKNRFNGPNKHRLTGSPSG